MYILNIQVLGGGVQFNMYILNIQVLGGSNSIFARGKICVFPFFPMGKKYMEREGNEYFPLSFHILFSHFSPWGKMGKKVYGPLDHCINA